ncbi:MAG: O-antigen ligase family protein [Gammaproteobacteria bacterium]|nr:O-antigen ligase family protein [Gammaproteobacteria bacterium]MDH3378583.1 O-antigen ligase family protein [Gammaproteobacteria bacterium]
MNLKTVMFLGVFGATGISLMGSIGDIRITSIGWSIPLLISVFSILHISRGIPKSLIIYWLPWVGLIVIAASMSEHENALLRAIILITPVVVAWAASQMSWNYVDILRYNQWAKTLMLIGVLVILFKVHIREEGFYERSIAAAESITAVFLAWLFYHQFVFFRSRQALLFWVIAISIPLASVTRMAAAAAVLSVMMSFAPIGRLRRLGWSLLGLSIFGIVALTPDFAEKMIGEGSSYGELWESFDVLQTSGRMVAWSALIDGIPEALLLGHGSNSTQTILQSSYDAFGHPHNDWLRILYEYGIVGTLIFLYAVVMQVTRLLRIGSNAVSVELKYASYLAASLFAPLLLLMVTDNVILYSAFFGNMHFLLIGIALSLSRSEAQNAAFQLNLTSSRASAAIGRIV